MLVGIPQADIARCTVASDSSGCAELRWWASGAVAGAVESIRVIFIELDSVRAILAKLSEREFGVQSIAISVVWTDFSDASSANEAFWTAFTLRLCGL